MNNWTYDNPLVTTHRFADIAVDGGAVEIANVLCSRAGMRGRLIGVTVFYLTATTVATATLTIGTAADADRYLAGSVPVAVIDSVINSFTLLTSDSIFIDGDVRTIIASDGGATAGDLDIEVIIGWY